MKEFIGLRWLLLASCLTIVIYAQGQAERPLEERIESQRIAFITERVGLSPEEAQVFWPIYNEYRIKEKTLRENQRAQRDILDMTESEANQHIDQILQLEQQELDLKKAYSEKLRTAISARKVLRFYAAERMFKERLLQVMSQRRKAGR